MNANPRSGTPNPFRAVQVVVVVAMALLCPAPSAAPAQPQPKHVSTGADRVAPAAARPAGQALAPPNDDCPDAIQLGDRAEYDFDTTGATTDGFPYPQGTLFVEHEETCTRYLPPGDACTVLECGPPSNPDSDRCLLWYCDCGGGCVAVPNDCDDDVINLADTLAVLRAMQSDPGCCGAAAGGADALYLGQVCFDIAATAGGGYTIRYRGAPNPHTMIATAKKRATLHHSGGHAVDRTIPQIHMHVVRIPAAQTVGRVIVPCKHHPLVEFAESDCSLAPPLVLNGPWYDHAIPPQTTVPMIHRPYQNGDART